MAQRQQLTAAAGCRSGRRRRLLSHSSLALSQRTAAEKAFEEAGAQVQAHIFHNCKRRTLGLRETRTREWLLALATEFGTKVGITDERVDPAEVASIVLEAASARNGWKVILKRCAPRSKPRTALQQLRESLATERA